MSVKPLSLRLLEEEFVCECQYPTDAELGESVPLEAQRSTPSARRSRPSQRGSVPQHAPPPRR